MSDQKDDKPTPGDDDDGRKAKTKRDQERRLDESLEETFPTSDPPSESQPGGGITGPGDDR
jgi:hypothetical protein